MGKTIILNLSNIKLTGDVLDVGESYGVIYNISKDTIALKMRDILTGAKSYSGTTLWLRIERDKKTYMLFGN